ncbi:IS3 family transposase [Streptomyces sp. NPDC023723]|uniref:IS3 family transposase n=1 Tax=Streptomyces sp. NPDC023723 TaxID=3154323 RepID=UPI0033E75206
MTFIDEHRDRFGGVEPICTVLTEHGVSVALLRLRRREELKPLAQEVFDADCRVYGARGIWHRLRRQGHQVARRTVERLMRELGLTGVVRGKRVVATVQDRAAERALDLIERDFVANAPDRTS